MDKGDQMTEYYGNSSEPERRFEEDNRPMAPSLRMVDWLIILVISMLPVVNVIVLVIWALDNRSNPNRRNFAQALLLLFGATTLIMSIFFGYFAGMIYRVFTLL